MPNPLDQKYIWEAENLSQLKFPKSYSQKMRLENGGVIENDEYFFRLFPILDSSSKESMKETADHVIKETMEARSWYNFPENAVAIGSDESGNFILLLHQGDGILDDTVYYWNHEDAQTMRLALSINELMQEKSL